MAVKFANNAKSTLNGAHNDSTTTIAVVDGSVFPTLSGADYFYMTLEDVSLNREIVKVTARSGNSLTVVRAQDGTTARSFSTADKAELRITVAGLTDIMALASDAIAALSSVYQALDADLTSWAGVTRASGFDTFAATPSSANLRSLVTDETGSGSLVFGTSPTLTTPALGTPSALVLTNATGLPNSSVIGLGTAALVNTGTSGATIPLLNGANTWSAAQSISNNVAFNVNETGGTARSAVKMDTSNNMEFGNANNNSEYIGASHAFSSSVGNFTIGGITAVTISDSQTLSNKTISSPTLSGTLAGSVTASGNWTYTANIYVGDSGGALVLSAGTYYQSFDSNDYLAYSRASNQWSWNIASSAIFALNATTANFNTTNLQHGGVAVPTISSTDTLTNKTLTSPTISGTVAGSASWSGTQTFNGDANYFGEVGDASTHVTYFRSDAGNIADIAFNSGSTTRWSIRKDGTAESGANAGSGFSIIARDDSGVYIGSALYITRATMAVALGGTSLTLGGVAVPTISSTDTLTNKTLTSPTISGTIAGSPTASGTWTFGGAKISGTSLGLDFTETDAGVDATRWRFGVNAGIFTLQTRTDADVFAASPLTITRSGTSITSIALASTALTWNGVAVPTISSTDTLTNKTLSSPTLSGTVAGTPTWASAQTFPSSTVIGTGAAASRFALNGAAATWRYISATTAGVARWDLVLANSASEAGSNTGSNMELRSYTDAGSALRTDLTITRSSGAWAIAGTSMTLGGVAVPTISSTDTLTNKTLSSPTLSGTVAGTPTYSSTPTFSDNITVGGSGAKYVGFSSGQNALLLDASNGTGLRSTANIDMQIDCNNDDTTRYFQVSTNSSTFGAGTALFKVTEAGTITASGVAIPTISSTDTLSNKTLASPTLSGTVAGTPTFSGALSIAPAWSASQVLLYVRSAMPTSGTRGITFTAPATDSSSASFIIGTGNGIDFQIDAATKLSLSSAGDVLFTPTSAVISTLTSAGAITAPFTVTNASSTAGSGAAIRFNPSTSTARYAQISSTNDGSNTTGLILSGGSGGSLTTGLTISGTGAVDAPVSLTIGSVAVPTISSTDTLTNKTISSPTLSGTVAGSPTFSGTPVFSSGLTTGTTNTVTIGTDGNIEIYRSGGYAFIDFKNSSGDDFDIRIQHSGANSMDFTASGGLTHGGVAIPTISSTDTLTNKTLSSPTLSGTVAGTPTISSAWTWSSAQQFPTVELGHASDTTVSRLAAGQVGVEGKAVIQHAGSYTSGQTTFSTSDPSGGSDGDIWYKHAA